MESCSLGIDIGGTKIAAGLVSRSGEVFEQKNYPTPQESNQSILEVLREIISSFPGIALEMDKNLIGIGVGSAGQVNFKDGQILSGTTNIKDWNNIHITKYLNQFTDLPIWLDNDANTFAVAEYVHGSARGTNDMVCLTLGTGVGGGIISNGDLIRGDWGGAAELGHITVDMNGPACNCGSNGCMEVYASGTGIANRMKEHLAHLAKQELPEEIKFYLENPERLTSKEVFSWYEAGLPVATETINLAIQALSYGIVSIIHTFNPSVIVLGGGLVRERTWLATEIKKNIASKGIRSLVEPVDIRISELGYHAGLIGAASQVWFQQ
ncbi:ROK family protein [Ornithinibacillus salinisoli]|uniref:ROK family protein n=1 Tax=Ornithinibacillus salinisoli TaxID=1848459 RepID=A0ABW4VZ94_9BACI